jgi:hypothetical protein
MQKATAHENLNYYANVYAVEKCVVGYRLSPFQ